MDDDFCLNISYGEVAERQDEQVVGVQVKKQKKKENGKVVASKEEKPSKSASASQDADNSSVLTTKKYKSVSKEEDPLHYHTKPRDLDHIVPMNKELKVSKGDGTSHIFSSNPFSSLPLHGKLISLLQAPVEESGFNLSYSTKVQNVIIPLLHQTRSNVLMKSQTGTRYSFFTSLTHSLTHSPTHSLTHRKW